MDVAVEAAEADERALPIADEELADTLDWQTASLLRRSAGAPPKRKVSRSNPRALFEMRSTAKATPIVSSERPGSSPL